MLHRLDNACRSMFSLAFIETLPHSLAVGEITIGSFAETFEADLSYWSPEQYRQQWVDAVRQLASGSSRAAFITSMVRPKQANFIVWWKAWRKDERVLVQNQILFLDQLAEPFEEANPSESVGLFRRTSEEGDPISTWETSANAVAAFGERLARMAV